MPPHGYEVIRDALIKAGKPEDKAKEEASRIWNKKNKGTGKTVGNGRK